MLKHKRLVSIIATIAFCLSFLAPAIIAPAPAVAAANYTVFRPATIAQVGDKITDTMIQIDIPNVAALATNDILTIGFPAGIAVQSDGYDVTAPLTLDTNADKNTITNNHFTAEYIGPTVLNIKMKLDDAMTGKGRLLVHLTNVVVNKVFEGDIKATFNSPNPGFTDGSETIATFIGSNTATYCAVGDVVSMGTEKHHYKP